MTRLLRVGLAGLGSMGKNHLRVLRSLPNVQLVAVVDSDPAKIAEVIGLEETFTSFETMLAEAYLDAVVVATPTDWHFSHVVAALRAGISVFVEKPLAATGAEARDLTLVARALHVPLMVGHIERFNPAVLKLREVLHLVGQIQFVEARRSGLREARTRSASGVGIELVTHDVDVVSWLLDERPVRAYASTACIQYPPGQEDLLKGILKYPSGAVASVSADWLSPYKVRKLRVLGSEGAFSLNYIEQKLAYYSVEGKPLEIEVTHEEPLVAELQAFFAAIEAGHSVMPTSVEDGAWAVYIVEALLASSQSGEPVVFKPQEFVTPLPPPNRSLMGT